MSEQLLNVVVSGDSLLAMRIPKGENEAFFALAQKIREADFAHTHLETLLHDYHGPELYPSAEAGWGWMRGPKGVAKDLHWLGIDLVSLASNHALDYSYGGLFSTWEALQDAGVAHAGTGLNLGESRAPAFVQTAHARVAVVSATSSFPKWARAGEARSDMIGRPGVNPLRYHHQIDAETMETVVSLSRRLGSWVTKLDNEYVVNPAGLHNTLWRFEVTDQKEVTTILDEDDLAGNLASVANASRQADIVIMHLHTHEWDGESGVLSSPASFVRPFAQACIDAGAHIFLAQGSHAPLRGIEIYKGRPIFYDPGDPFALGRADRVPADFYLRWGYDPKARRPGATPADAYEAWKPVFGRDPESGAILSPKEPYSRNPGFVLPVCQFNSDLELHGITLYPATWLMHPRSHEGLPALAKDEQGTQILRRVEQLSEPYGTEIRIEDAVGQIRLTDTKRVS